MIYRVRSTAFRHMGMKYLFCMSALFCTMGLRAQLKRPVAGMRITASVKFAAGTYRLNNNEAPAIEIEGNNLVIDFNHAVLDGNVNNLLPDSFSGIAVKIISGKNITVKNLTAKGYKVALMAAHIKNLNIAHCNFSYNYRQHLNSTQQKEDLSDWMSYHRNEKDEWLRYGAGIYLRGCHKAVVHDNTITGGQCALMLTQCDSAMIYNNDFSFNSGIGIGMYRSSFNTIIHNKLDFNVRGHSEGVYNRGQDAAAILVFEQCNKNVFAFNSATHSGDGFFLWAGQTTMDYGTGGCNDNLIFKNDFSYAPTNGIEVTFSRNRVSFNKMIECDNAVWGGYSYNSVFKHNEIANCNTGIAIEHGQSNIIEFNTFRNCTEAIKLWARASQPADWGYANKRDTRSRNYTIGYNRFLKNKRVFNFFRTTHIDGIKNDTAGNEIFIKTDSTVKENNITRFTCCDNSFESFIAQEKRTAGIQLPWKKNLVTPDTFLMGRRQIRMTEWGPYDFRSPLIWNTSPVSESDTMQFEIIGPKGNWRLVNQRGVKDISVSSGTIPATISAIKTNENGQDIFIELEYSGEAVISPFGDWINKGATYRFNYRNALLPASWTVSWYGFDSLHNPVKNPSLLPGLLQQPAFLSEKTNAVNYAWWNGAGTEKKQEQFITVAESDINFPEGEYLLGISWEDVVRVYLDGILLLDEWKPTAHLYDESPHRELPVKLSGKHHLRAEQSNEGGFATLIIKLKKK